MEQTYVNILDKTFGKYLSFDQIQDSIALIATKINNLQLDQNSSIFISVLNGSFMFSTHLLSHLSFTPYISFIKLASYENTQSTGTVNTLIGLEFPIKNKTVFILEDIIDSGNTIEFLYNYCKEQGANKIFIVSLLLKPEAYKKNIPIDFTCFKIPNDFVIGFGMDYNGLGRNLKDLYVLK